MKYPIVFCHSEKSHTWTVTVIRLSHHLWLNICKWFFMTLENHMTRQFLVFNEILSERLKTHFQDLFSFFKLIRSAFCWPFMVCTLKDSFEQLKSAVLNGSQGNHFSVKIKMWMKTVQTSQRTCVWQHINFNCQSLKQTTVEIGKLKVNASISNHLFVSTLPH